jgi:hypothetical protein
MEASKPSEQAFEWVQPKPSRGLWYKCWLESRWGFIIGLVGLTAAYFLTAPWDPSGMTRWLAKVQRAGASGTVVQLLSSYQGYVWGHWFKSLLLLVWPAYAISMGTLCMGASCTSLVGGSQSAAYLYTLSLPVTRRRLLTAQIVTSVLELTVIALVPSLSLPLFSQMNGYDYPVTDTGVHVFLMVMGGMVFFAFSCLLSLVFGSQWAVYVIGFGVFFALWPFRELEAFPWWSIYRVMTGEDYFLHGHIPWLGLLISVLLTLTMFYLSIRIFERRDF